MNEKEYYHYVLAQDQKALHVGGVKDWLFHDIWRFQRTLRKLEYYGKIKKNPIVWMWYLYVRFSFHKQSVRLGFSISPYSIAEGLEIGHYGDIVINGKARLGKNCTIAGAGVLVGEDLKSPLAPIIGDECYLGPGCKIIGPVTIAKGVTIAANCVVTRDITEPYTTVGGIPARKISDTSVKKKGQNG